MRHRHTTTQARCSSGRPVWRNLSEQSRGQRAAMRRLSCDKRAGSRQPSASLLAPPAVDVQHLAAQRFVRAVASVLAIHAQRLARDGHRLRGQQERIRAACAHTCARVWPPRLATAGGQVSKILIFDSEKLRNFIQYGTIVLIRSESLGSDATVGEPRRIRITPLGETAEEQKLPGDDQYISRGNRYFTVDGGRLRQSGPRPDARLLRQPAIEGLMRSAWTDSPRQVGRNNFPTTQGGRGGDGDL
ncbi:hypothetical protein F511_02674 [Dorcoceras hygrometricum]|uniref:Uncharacterized protein n=1 Tax=Dorcoceras hygrometricum TaxID=472368 RepID=A0A2Z7D670_9LAMI|nr:hypothetical protein F511_02674 [Dorcoceras hygrometricum]